MKKFLTIILALVMSVSMATFLVACNDGEHTHTYATDWTSDGTHHWHAATCEHTTEVSGKAEHSFGTDGKCTVCQKDKPVVEPVYTVTEEEWATFFNSVDNVEYYFEADVVMGANETTMVVANKDNLFCMTSDFETGYVSFDDANLVLTMYFKENNDWSSSSRDCASEEEYINAKAYYSLSGVVFDEFLGSVEQDGEIVDIDELFSAFTYNDGKYSATLYREGTSIVWTVKFENGKMVALNIVQGTAGSLVGAIIYDNFELAIPNEALNATP